MRIRYGKGTTEYGPGVSVLLDGGEVATAISAYLVSHGIHVDGPRTVTVNGKLCRRGEVYCDPEGFVISNDGIKFCGNGKRPCAAI